MHLKIEELAELLGKKRWEVEEMLKNNDVIELKLSERKSKYNKEEDELRIYE
jgi:plasmid maintenance system antidote protein VapI|tara:strand:- start:11706 stop:11861 length:156 start_codon:yes stop_codon:yes gene_type:complete